MKIHKEGHIIVFIAVVVTVFVYALALTLGHWASYLLLTATLIGLLWILYFFRVPKRNVAIKHNILLSPADGKVIRLEESFEEEFFGKPMQHLSIFMSPFNVHLNRYPSDGKISYYKYHHGKYLVAWHPKSSTLNERTSLVIETPQGFQYLLRQIAGILARRIVCYATEGKQVKQGDELGFIKFGSRLDLFLPHGSKVLVKPGDKVKGGISEIAEISGVLEPTRSTT